MPRSILDASHTIILTQLPTQTTPTKIKNGRFPTIHERDSFVRTFPQPLPNPRPHARNTIAGTIAYNRN
ncbi:hypothetical protein QUB75_12725 [Microcoleus sp. K1-B6]|uniref:hypothetical protein n=1 Tax=unclassified Microcoleus TaxID=2642155 RepID=UPI002FCFFB55